VTRLRVVIADDQPMMRAGFKAVLEATGDIQVVAEAATGAEAVAAANQYSPDVVLIDIRMPEMDGIEATRRLPRQRILILTTFGIDDYIIDALRAGASGFLLKDAPTAEVVDAVRAVAAGMSNAEIAHALVVSEATVKSHVSNLLGKLGLRDRVQAVIYAYETRLIAPADH
jgi:DNA-binding NarL/FixJ family response regulator